MPVTKLWEYLVRFRTWIVNLVLAITIVAPDILNSPEVLAVIPAEYQRYVLAAGFLLNIWMRPRPAVMANDLEASVSRSRKK